MKRTVRVLRKARTDLEEIQRYVERDRPDAADRLVEGLLNGIESLGRLPERGKVPRDDRLKVLGFRVLGKGQYLIFCKPVRTQVRVYRVIHGRRRYEHMI